MPAKKEQKDGVKKNANGILASAALSVGVLVNARFEIQQFYGFTGKYLDSSPGNADLNVIKMAKEEFAFEIQKGLESVKKSGESYIQEIILPDNHQLVILEILPFFNTTDAHFFILFKENVAITEGKHDATNGKTKKPDNLKEAKDHIQQLEKELAGAKEGMQNLVEEHSIINEELLSGNEELQRLYEELETSSEELQSTNEELISVNEELLDRNDELNQSRKFAEATIATLHEPLLILDHRFIVRDANKSFYNTFQLTKEETLGNILFELQDKAWNIPGLAQALKKIQKEKLVEKEITFSFPVIGERNIIFNIQPIQKDTGEKLILLAFNDITEIKNMVMLKEKAALLSKERQLLHDFFMQAPALFAILKGPEHIFEFANPLSIEFFGNRNPTGKSIREALPELEGQGFYELLDNVYKTGETFYANEIPAQLNRGNLQPDQVYVNLSYQPLKNEQGQIEGILAFAVEVTEQIIVRKKIEEAEARFRMALKGSSHIVFSQDENLKHTWIYNSHPDFDAAAIIGKDDEDLHEPATAERLMILKKSVLASGNAVHTEIPMMMNGKQEFYDLIIEPIKNERGKTEGITGVAVKITENVIARKKLQDSEERFTTIVNASNLGLWDYDALNDRIILTGKMAEIYGYSSNEIITVQDLYDAIHQEDREIQANHYKELMTPDTQYPCEVELRIISKQTNQVKWINSNCKSFFNDEGKMYRMVGTTTDITAQKSAESDLKRFQHMADNATEPFILMREDASFAYLNDVALERWGYTKEEALHIRVPDVDPNYTDEVFPPAFAAAQKGEVLLFETLHKRKDGTIYPVEVNMSGVILEGKPHLFAIARDIRERKKTEEILNYRKALLEAQNEAIPDAILIVDTKGNMLSFNQHFIKLWKIPEDIINRKDDAAALQFAMTQLTDPQGFIDRVNYCYANPDEKAKEEVHFKDGRIIERYGNVVVGEDGISYGWAWYFRDITEQRKAQENIKIVKDQLELTFKNIPAGVYLLNHKGEMLYVNEKGAKVYGDFTPEDFLAEKDLPSLFKIAEEHFDRYDDKGNIFKPQNSPAYITLTTGLSSEAILRQVNKITKEERWHYVQGAPLFDEEGKVSMVLVTSTDITVQKNAEEKIRQSEERFQAAVAAVEGILWTNNANGEMVGEQPGWAMLTGQTFEEYQGFGWASAVHPDDAQPTVDAWNETVKEKKIFVFEHRVKMKDGSWGHFSIRAIPLLNNDGSIRQWVGVHTNITEQRHAEELLSKSEEQLRSLANSIPQLAWMTEADGWIYWYNQRWYDYTGTTLEEVQGWGWQSVHHPELVAEVTERFSKAIASGVPYEQTYLLRSKEGEYRWFLTRAIPIRNDEGKVMQWFGTNTDVTDQRNIEDALKESEARFRLLANSMPQQIWTGDAEGNLNYFNAAVYEFSGLTFDDIQREGWIQIVHPDDREANITKWIHSITTGEDFFIEHRFKHNSGEYRWQLSRAIPQRNNEGHIQLWVGTSTDIHEQKIKEQKKDEFLSIASHEMKTPLTTAKAYLQLLEHSLDKENESANLYAKKAKDSIARINDLIGELLDVSKIQYGKLNYNLASFNFNEMIEGIVEDMQHSSPKHALIKTGNVQQEVRGDKDRLQQVVINLISNAIKYSPDAGKVFIEVAQQNDKIKVSVRDTGIGMSAHHLEKIFDRYYRVEEHAIQFQGLGIGLYISNEIILRHNGKLWAESEPGKGSTFYFTLPVTTV